MIGIFDSGSGGLTVLKALREELPSADVLYFGDIKHAPYGGRPPEELAGLTVRGLKLLKDRGARHIMSACNSVSASLAVSLMDALDLLPGELVEMVGPTVRYFRYAEGRLALCATPATIRSGIYQNGFRMIGKDVLPIAIPDLAGAIEFGEPPDRIREMVEAALRPHRGDFDMLILACTHYPLVAELFQAAAGSGVLVFDPAVAAAERARQLFWPKEMGSGGTRFLVSQDSPVFRRRVREMFDLPDEAVAVLPE